MLEEFDLNLLTTLHSLIVTRSVTLTAQRLGVSQPAVSRSLGRLRELLHDPLLIKTNSGMALTHRAKSMEEPLNRWLGETEALLRQGDAENPRDFTGEYRVASSDFGVLAVLTPALERISRAAPDLCLKVEPLSPAHLSGLAVGDVDLVLTSQRPQPTRVFERLLFVETYQCILRVDHPLMVARRTSAVASRLTLDEFLAWPHVINTAQGDDPAGRRLDVLGLERRIIMHMPYSALAATLTLNTDAIMMVPSRAARLLTSSNPDLTMLSAPFDFEPFDYWLLWHGRSRQDPVVQWLVDQLGQLAEVAPRLGLERPPASGPPIPP
ncbi:LysR family transcriptional regulator [Caulobacter segnis]|uniref:LysR family transcriptional regulator n=1 Tax=Caulobacter segnis TaxID=88688 RepID=UPI00285E2B68|nr:LysR family transcriptional regulator [Caulobacter segnis]MDR6625235.1 DNA-binding transcriptional LysR family regulator [Caulobacter segnis]